MPVLGRLCASRTPALLFCMSHCRGSLLYMIFAQELYLVFSPPLQKLFAQGLLAFMFHKKATEKGDE